MRNEILKTLFTAAAIVGAAMAINLIGGGRPSQAQSGQQDVLLIPVGNGAAAWIHTPKEGLEYCYIDGNYMRCIRR